MKQTADPSLEPAPPLPMPNRLVRLFHALTSYSLRELSRRTGIPRSTLALYESGDAEPSAAHLEALAREAGRTVEHGREMLRWHDSLDWPRLRAGGGVEALFAKASEQLHARLERAYQRFLCLPLVVGKPGMDKTLAMLDLAEAERSAAWAQLTEEIARLVESVAPAEKEEKGGKRA